MFSNLLKRFRRHDGSSAGFYSKLIGKAKHRGGKKPYVEQTVGDDLHRKSSRWMKVIDELIATASGMVSESLIP